MIFVNQKGHQVFEILNVKVDMFFHYGNFKILDEKEYDLLISKIDHEGEQLLTSNGEEYYLVEKPSDETIEVRAKP